MNFKKISFLTNLDSFGTLEKLSPTFCYFNFLSERKGYVSNSYVFWKAYTVLFAGYNPIT